YNKPFIIKGPVIDLFDPQLPVLDQKAVNPGEQSLLYNVGRIANKSIPQVLAAASRASDELVTANSYSFTVKSPVKTMNSMRVLLPAEPKSILVTDNKGLEITGIKSDWDKSTHTLYLGFANSPDGIRVLLKW
ncbi:MAG TPA: hypothetical protein VIM77_15175, partial [Mucilaginibacter sp.]